VQKLVTIQKKDIFTLDLSEASVVTLYLLPDLNVKLIPQLKKLKAGSRIVSHAFDMRGVTPDKGYPIKVKTKEGLEHDVYLWTTPLKIEKEKEYPPSPAPCRGVLLYFSVRQPAPAMLECAAAARYTLRCAFEVPRRVDHAKSEPLSITGVVGSRGGPSYR